jgi:hypothetical protein
MFNFDFLPYAFVNTVIQLTIFFILAIFLSKLFDLESRVFLKKLTSFFYAILVFFISLYAFDYIHPLRDSLLYSISSIRFINRTEGFVALGVAVGAGFCFYKKLK